ncbi:MULTISPECIES: OsmC family protein [unclassified Rhizobium]|uniref:OsmC family protein n=1 Tax=unclassified Rhizobium TaxID=2613769 RepID=UPI00146F15E8|nr:MULTISPECIES: OsmC family protein [unclassified Rhizobium]MBD9448337.1 OsmC family protein [Rhizobium sp. RHZ01]
MVAVTVELRNVEGTQAAMEWAGPHTIIVDRPEGKAGGQGLGFNGAQLLALALGGCFCNDLRYVAEEMGVLLGRIAVSVVLELEGSPLLAKSAKMTVLCEKQDGDGAERVIERAKEVCMVANSLGRGVAVSIEHAA